jgi:hypothetical protein
VTFGIGTGIAIEDNCNPDSEARGR